MTSTLLNGCGGDYGDFKYNTFCGEIVNKKKQLCEFCLARISQRIEDLKEEISWQRTIILFAHDNVYLSIRREEELMKELKALQQATGETK